MEIDSNDVTVDFALVALSSGLLSLAFSTAKFNGLAVAELHLHPAPVVGVSDGGVARVNLSELTGRGNFTGSSGTGLGLEASSHS